MINIVIEMYSLRYEFVGLGEFNYRLCEALAARAEQLKSDYDIELHLIVPSKFVGRFGNSVRYIQVPSFWGRVILGYTRRHVDLFHLTHQYCRYKSMPWAKHTLLTVHDINFIYEKQGEKLTRGIKRFNKMLSKANYVNFISDFAMADTNKHFKVNVPQRVIYNGVADLHSADESNLSSNFKSKIPNEFMLHISSLQPKKNVHLLVDMMQYLPDKKLVIAGDWNTPYGSDLRHKAEHLPSGNVVCLDNVSAAEKAYLFSRCEALLFPSLCEGFGLPPIEAMKFGKPVFLSTLTSLPEVGGEHAFYWDILSPKIMADTVREKLPTVTSELKQALIDHANQFQWSKCADEYIDYYLEILGIEKKI